jgi:GT2 family glycosyltransferase
VVSGVESAGYDSLRRNFPNVRWIFRGHALDYGLATELGLAQAKYPWLYLLNSDMHLRPDALAEVLKLRRWDTFAIGSRIRMQDGSNTETNWTDLRYCEGDAAELIERDPADVREPRGCLYVGGGSGLFRASLLKKFVTRTRAYAPFYWEDVEWGSLAWRYGYQCTFCPASEAVHGHRQTIARYYSEPEVSRVFERNRVLFHLRNLGGLGCLEKRLLSLDGQSWKDIFTSGVLCDTAWARATAFMAPRKEEILMDRWKISL